VSRAPWLVGLVLAAGCSEKGGTTPAAARDSAGVAIVESISPQWQPGEEWQVDSVPLLDLGGGGGPAFEFDVVADAIRLDDGSVVVADFSSRELRRFGADGAIQWVSGREGDGPGEYNRVRNIARYRGDSLLVCDVWMGRATVLDAGGQVGRTFRLGVSGRSDRMYPVNDSTLLVTLLSMQALEKGAGMVRLPEPLVRVRPDGSVVDTIAVLAGWESFMMPQGEVRPLFGRRQAPMAVADGALYLGTADRMEYTVHAEDGRLTRAVRVPGYDLALTARQVEAERARMVTPGTQDWYRDAVASLPAPATRPAFAQLLVDRTGAVWLAPFRGESEVGVPMPWQVFDAEGVWLGAVSLPVGMRVVEIGTDYVLGVRRDSDGVEHVQVLRLHRR